MCVCVPGRTGSECELCEAGTFKDTVGSGACTACPVFTTSFTGATAATDCLCQAGYHGSTPGACVACAADTYKPFIGNHAQCLACPPNSETVATASSALTACQCSPGYTGVDGGSCAACALHTFKSETGSLACTSCHDNSETLQTASTSSTQCLCSARFTIGDGDCIECAANTFKNLISNNPCTPCSAFGDHSSTQGITGAYTSCECVCDAGYQHGSYCAYCQPCQQNHYCPAGTTDTAHSCPDFSHTDFGSTPSAPADCICDAEYFRQGTSCVPCTADYFCDGVQGGRTRCPENSTAPAASSSEAECTCVNGFEKQDDT